MVMFKEAVPYTITELILVIFPVARLVMDGPIEEVP
jgi:hypothetical protein